MVARGKITTAVNKAGAVASRSFPHREATIESLRADAAHGAALIEAALASGDAGDLIEARKLIADANGQKSGAAAQVKK